MEDAVCDYCMNSSWSISMDRGDGLRIVECDECGLAYLNPWPQENLMTARYENDYASENLDEKWSDCISFETTRDDIRMIKRYRDITGMAAMDVGCGQGIFLDSLRRQGAGRIVGIDLSRKKIEYASRKLPGAEFITGKFEDLEELAPEIQPLSLDLLVAIDLIEHLYSPSKFFEFASRFLKPGGLLFLETPNWNATRRYGSRWEGLWRDYEHVHYFNAETVSRYLGRYGFSPLGYDYKPCAAGLGSTRCLTGARSNRPEKSLIRSIRTIIRRTPVINKEVYRLLQFIRRLRNYSDIRNATSHSLIVAAVKESEIP